MTASAPRARRRPRWVVPVVVLVIVALLLGGLGFAGEALARSIGTSVAQKALASALQVADPKDVDVDLGSGSVLIQAIGGRLDEVTASTDGVDFSGISGDLALDARGVPLAEDGRVSTLDARVTISATEAEKLAKRISSIPIDDVAFAKDGLRVTVHATVFGASIPVVVLFAPSVSGGRLVLTPTTAQVAGASIDVQDLRSRFGAIGDAIPANLSVCVDEKLPAGVDLSGIAVTSTRISLTATGRNVALSGSGRGSCS